MNAPRSPIEPSAEPRDVPPYDDDERATDLLSQLFGVLAIVRRRFAIIAVMAVLGIAGAGLAIKLLPKRHRAHATILLAATIDPERYQDAASYYTYREVGSTPVTEPG